MANSPYIALADDDPEDQELLADRILKDHPDISFKFFSDGLTIIQYLEHCPCSGLPAMIILDYKMPKQGGADVLKILQNNSKYDDVRKVIWSTSDNIQYVTECMQYGVDKYFTKPISMEQLDHIVHELCDILLFAKTC